MTPSPIAGFITKKETAHLFQRSHRQITRDLADAMKMQNPKVLDNCRLRTEDGETRDGIGVTSELLDELRIAGKNPVWYLRVTWLEKMYGRRGRPQRPDKISPEEFTSEKEGSDPSSRPDLVRVLRERIRGLEQDKEELRDEMRIKNQQIADRNEREKETNALIRNLQTLMADLQGRLLPSPTPIARQIMDAHPEGTASSSRTDETIVRKSKPVPSEIKQEKGSRTLTKKPEPKSRHKVVVKKSAVPKKPEPNISTKPVRKSKSLWSRLFPR
jgi:hypothetical protein